MAPALDKPRLRRALSRLRAVARDSGMVQEALDFIAMMAGAKPVYLYRGGDQPAWTGEVRVLSAEQGFHVLDAGYWDAGTALAGLPDWYVRAMRQSMAGYSALYVARTRANGEAVRAACATLAPTVEEEARLLGYPLCCVVEHHGRTRRYHELMVRAATRAAAGDVERAYDMVARQAPPELNDDEREEFARVMDMRPMPYTSVVMCRACGGATSPAARLARRYADLANAVDPNYFEVVLDD